MTKKLVLTWLSYLWFRNWYSHDYRTCDLETGTHVAIIPVSSKLVLTRLSYLWLRNWYSRGYHTCVLETGTHVAIIPVSSKLVLTWLSYLWLRNWYSSGYHTCDLETGTMATILVTRKLVPKWLSYQLSLVLFHENWQRKRNLSSVITSQKILLVC